MNLNRLSVDQVHLEGVRLLIRTDFNVPMQDGVITDNKKITAALETISYVLNKGAKCVVLISHLGKPYGKHIPLLSLHPIADELSKLLKKHVTFLPDCMGLNVESECANPVIGTVILLENLRFHIEEEVSITDHLGTKLKAEPYKVKQFKENLRKLADIYVNDTFNLVHYAHSSMLGEGFEKRCAGFLMKREFECLSKIFSIPVRPLVAIFGGSKLMKKIHLIDKLIDKVNDIIIVGGIALTFLKVISHMRIGRSFFDVEGAEHIHSLKTKADKHLVKIHLPVDFVIADKFSENSQVRQTNVIEGIPDDWFGMDIGPKTHEIIKEVLKKANTIFLNGAAGVYEFDKFSTGSKFIINELVAATEKGCFTVVGGIDTTACCNKTKAHLSHISTGGEASLELLEGKELPGISSLCLA